MRRAAYHQTGRSVKATYCIMSTMQPDVLIVKNITREGPGLLERVLAEHDIAFVMVDLSAGEAFPAPNDYRAVVVLSGPASANDTDEKMTQELVQVRQAIDRGVPYLGVCLGMQVLVRAAGGRVLPAPIKEIGFVDAAKQPYTVQLTEAGMHDPLLAGLSQEVSVFQLHGETVQLTSAMQSLATGRGCPNQIVKVGACAYGVQSHFELTESMLHGWAEDDPDLKPLGTDYLLAEFARQRGTYTVTGLTLFRNFLGIAGLI